MDDIHLTFYAGIMINRNFVTSRLGLMTFVGTWDGVVYLMVYTRGHPSVLNTLGYLRCVNNNVYLYYEYYDSYFEMYKT